MKAPEFDRLYLVYVITDTGFSRWMPARWGSLAGWTLYGKNKEGAYIEYTPPPSYEILRYEELPLFE